MTHHSAPLWHEPIPGQTEKKLRNILSCHRDISVFFRADDIGAAGDKKIDSLLELFLQHQVPLCLAVVPTWINKETWDSYKKFQRESSLWCWHQHGYSHTNHEKEGKKAEFGKSRTTAEIKTELEQGKKRLKSLLGPNFTPVFTPPWNRCSKTTLDLLSKLEFSATSRSSDPRKEMIEHLPEISINIDLHTRKEPDQKTAWNRLYKEIEKAASQGMLGFMLHHLLMNEQAYLFLDLLLRLLKEYQLPCITFRELL